MISQRPYLLRAMYEWILDNGWTPYVQVYAHWPGTQVPTQFVDEEGHIVLNISPEATRQLELDNDEIHFSARFNGQAQWVRFSPDAVVAIFSKETGHGMPFLPSPQEMLAEYEATMEDARTPEQSTSQPAAEQDTEEEDDNKVIRFPGRR